MYVFHTQNLLHVTCAYYMKLLWTYMSSRYLISHYWPNGSTSWPTLEDLLLQFWQYDLVLQLKYYMIGSSLLTGTQLACSFWANLAPNQNSYHKLCMSSLTCMLFACLHINVKHVSHTVQFNYNFTHEWDSTHGNTQFFACQMPGFSVELVIYTQGEKPFTRYEKYDRHESCRHGHVSRTRRTDTWL